LHYPSHEEVIPKTNTKDEYKGDEVRHKLFKAAEFLLLFAVAAAACAAPVGELHRVAFDSTASLRDAQHRSDLRITVWYPASADAVERPVVIGPPDKPLFDVGFAAPGAPFAAGGPRPVILLSHGFGGTARVMGWFGIALARDGYVVVAVDHPGNNGADPMTAAGALLAWDRAEDLRVALDAMARDPVIGPHVDVSRLGVAGFSAGGYTSLVAAGAQVQPSRLLQFCHANPDDAMCRPQLEFAVTQQDYEREIERPVIRAAFAHAGDDHTIGHIRAVFVMAPALIQSLQPASLRALRAPVQIVLGDDDEVAPPATNGVVAAQLIPDAVLTRFAGVTHYDFLATCTDEGRTARPYCRQANRQDDVHRLTIDAARTFFEQQLGGVAH
jgi:predicted dienelactone hydrolase